MSVAVITGSSGLIGSETARFLHAQGMEIVGIDNDLRAYFFGSDASTAWNTEQLKKELKHYQHYATDIRDIPSINKLFSSLGKSISLVVHTASQPSHDWAAREPATDFTVNANGTLNMLEATRQFAPDATFIFTSTNKVYGDTPNFLPLVEKETRWEIQESHPYHEFGIDEQMSIDQSKHSLFGVSKVAADVLTQEFGRYFGLKTGTFRGGCLTGPAHSGAELHGFLAYLVKCALTGKPYTIYGYKGKQVRDNIHSYDLVTAFWNFFQQPIAGEVYNIGGSRHSNCSMLEAIAYTEELTGKEFKYTLSDQARSGDHIWWISDVRKFKRDYPGWDYIYDMKKILEEIVEATRERAQVTAN
ncbi:MAG TPA: NAD-dependent epimerase/dehydratase family protein [Pyrinomonadaceae bacterium]|jgi:CDP-paratose 2-epimerase